MNGTQKRNRQDRNTQIQQPAQIGSNRADNGNGSNTQVNDRFFSNTGLDTGAERSGTRNPALRYNQGVLSYYKTKYIFKKEGETIMKNYFSALINQDVKYPPAYGYEKFAIQAYEEHPHPVGATFRAFMQDMITYKHAPTGRILDIGASLNRNRTRWEYIDGVLTPLMDRMHSMAPLLSGKDLIRDAEHPPDEIGISNWCRCVAGQQQNRCTSCEREYKTVIAIDSIYYPGVLEEMMERAWNDGSIGYFAFNDYHAALLKNGRTGKCADNESSYSIDNEFIVTSTVEGNFAPYVHKILRTDGLKSWQSGRLRGGKLDWCVFQVLSEVWNGDVPYRLVKVIGIHGADLPQEEKSGLQGVTRLTGFLNNNYSLDDHVVETILVDTTIKPEVALVKALEVAKELKIEKLKLPPLTMQISEFAEKSPPQPDMKLIDYRQRDERVRTDNELKAFFQKQFIAWQGRTNERFFVDVGSDGKQYANVEILSSAWYSLYFNYSKTLHRANLEYTYEAYNRLVNKNQLSSVTYTLGSAQKEMAKMATDYYEELQKKDGFHVGVDTTELVDAFIIGWIMRAQEKLRLMDVLKDSQSLNLTMKN